MTDASNLTNEEVNEIIFRVQSRASTDPDFRALCMSDPAAALRDEAGYDLPADFSVNVVDNSGADLTLVLPDMVASGAEELSDADLEAVAGGGRCGGSCGGSSGFCGGP